MADITTRVVKKDRNLGDIPTARVEQDDKLGDVVLSKSYDTGPSSPVTDTQPAPAPEPEPEIDTIVREPAEPPAPKPVVDEVVALLESGGSVVDYATRVGLYDGVIPAQATARLRSWLAGQTVEADESVEVAVVDDNTLEVDEPEELPEDVLLVQVAYDEEDYTYLFDWARENQIYRGQKKDVLMERVEAWLGDHGVLFEDGEE